MASIVILGAGISGHTAAMHLRRRLGRAHQITVVSPNSKWNWIPSNIWVGVGRMPKEKVVFPLAPIYKRMGVNFVQAKAVALWPHGDKEDPQGAVDIEYTDPTKAGQKGKLRYDYLINATGPKLKFEATEGLGPEGYTHSVCTADHAVEASAALQKIIAKARAGEHQNLVIGTGNPMCTCQGAAFEYTFNVDHELKQAGVRDKTDIYYLTNEASLGDFGVDGMVFEQQGFRTSSRVWTESLFRERGVKAFVGTAVNKIESDVIHFETLDGEYHELGYDFAMLIPPFGGVGLKAYDHDGEDITDKMFAPSGFMKVDANYTPKTYEEWEASDWPRTYEAPDFPDHFAVGIAFAPPHPISKPRKTANGTVISPAPPRTGMPSGVIGMTVAMTVADRVQGKGAPAHVAAMTKLGAACVASAGAGLTKGSAAAMTMYPVVPDYAKYPGTGRDLRETRGQIGLGGHWIKFMLHYLFIYKAKALPGWQLIPE